MKRILLTFLLIFCLSSVVLGEDFPPSGQGIAITKETNPIYWGYMEDYAEKLKQALEAKRMFRLRGMGASYKFFITRDGEIKDMKIDTYQNEYFNKKVKEIILSVKPLPFRDGMNMDEMLFSVYLGYEHYDEIDLGIGKDSKREIKSFHITIVTNR